MRSPRARSPRGRGRPPDFGQSGPPDVPARKHTEAEHAFQTAEEAARAEIQSEWADQLAPLLPLPAVQVKWRQVRRAMGTSNIRPDLDTVDAFIALGGKPDLTGEIKSDLLRSSVKNFQLTIDIDRLIAEADSDSSGLIDFEEFTAMFSQGEPGAAPANRSEDSDNGSEGDRLPVLDAAPAPRLSFLLGDLDEVFSECRPPSASDRPKQTRKLEADVIHPSTLPEYLIFPSPRRCAAPISAAADGDGADGAEDWSERQGLRQRRQRRAERQRAMRAAASRAVVPMLAGTHRTLAPTGARERTLGHGICVDPEPNRGRPVVQRQRKANHTEGMSVAAAQPLYLVTAARSADSPTGEPSPGHAARQQRGLGAPPSQLSSPRRLRLPSARQSPRRSRRRSGPSPPASPTAPLMLPAATGGIVAVVGRGAPPPSALTFESECTESEQGAPALARPPIRAADSARPADSVPSKSRRRLRPVPRRRRRTDPALAFVDPLGDVPVLSPDFGIPPETPFRCPITLPAASPHASSRIGLWQHSSQPEWCMPLRTAHHLPLPPQQEDGGDLPALSCAVPSSKPHEQQLGEYLAAADSVERQGKRLAALLESDAPQLKRRPRPRHRPLLLPHGGWGQ